MSGLDRYWLAPVPAVRGYLLQRTFLLLFALDVIADHLRPAWRYGTAGFDVPHAPLFALWPTPTTALYVGAMFVLAIASFVVALAPRPPRALMALIAVLYLWSWSSSMHDSYQHHYLLSLFFLGFAFLPPLSSWDLFGGPSKMRSPTSAPSDKPRKTGAPAARATARSIAGLRELAIGFSSAVIGAAWLGFAWLGDRGLAVPSGVLVAGVAMMARGLFVAKRSEGALSLDAALPHSLVPRASAFAMPALWVTTAIVYGYTAISKAEPEWRDGSALRDITREGARIPEAIELFGALGLEGDALWSFLGHSVIALQLGCALGYLTATLRERTEGPLRGVLEVIAYVALFLALSFHLGAEYMGLQIGWFSWYMILLALCTFLPARLLSAGVLLFSWPLREMRERREHEPSGVMAAALALIAGALLVPVGLDADLPGALGACVLAGCAMLAAGLFASIRGTHTAEIRAAALAVMVAALAIPVALRTLGGDEVVNRDGSVEPHYDVRYDYWRFAGGDFRRRGEWARALDAYVHANRHAPPDRNRRAQEDEMRERIRTEGPRRIDR